VASKELLNYKNIFNKTAVFLSLISLSCLATTTYAEQRKKIETKKTIEKRRRRKFEVKRSQNFCCHDCGKKFEEKYLETHHKKSKSKNGKNEKSNLIALGISINKGGCGCHDKRHNRNNSSVPTPS
jgi:5-methylcytosine-specific restriction endonuclease McrA